MSKLRKSGTTSLTLDCDLDHPALLSSLIGCRALKLTRVLIGRRGDDQGARGQKPGKAEKKDQ